MTDNTGQLMQDLMNKDLSDWSAEDIDSFIVDAYLSLEASLNGLLRTADGLLVEPNMGEWGAIDEEDGNCLACLAGAFFVSKTGTLIPEDKHPTPYIYWVTGMSVLAFMDGLRYLEEDSESGESMANLLNTMRYAVYPSKEGEGFSHMYEEMVAAALKRFIDLNPRLRTKLVEVLADIRQGVQP